MPSRDEARDRLLGTLEARFAAHMHRHEGLAWAEVRARLNAAPAALDTLAEMEASGGEPDVVDVDAETGAVRFVDCVVESPKGRRSVCYDREARVGRKKHPPDGSALERASAMGAELLDEAAYRRLQALGPVDTKTSSWLKTPADIRGLGGAIFGDHRYGTVFIYHNGADSYYGARGFRCGVWV